MALYCKYSHNFQVLDNKAKKYLKKSNSAYNIIETTSHIFGRINLQNLP